MTETKKTDLMFSTIRINLYYVFRGALQTFWSANMYFRLSHFGSFTLAVSFRPGSAESCARGQGKPEKARGSRGRWSPTREHTSHLSVLKTDIYVCARYRKLNALSSVTRILEYWRPIRKTGSKVTHMIWARWPGFFFVCADQIRFEFLQEIPDHFLVVGVPIRRWFVSESFSGFRSSPHFEHVVVSYWNFPIL